MSFDAVALAGSYLGPGSVEIEWDSGTTRGFLEIETLTASDGSGLTRTRRTGLRVIAGSLPDVGVDDEITIGDDRYRVIMGPDPIDDGAEEEYQLTGPL